MSNQTAPKPLKRDVDAARKAWPEAESIELERAGRGGKPEAYFVIVDDIDGDGVVAKGATERDAWAHAAERARAGRLTFLK